MMDIELAGRLNGRLPMIAGMSITRIRYLVLSLKLWTKSGHKALDHGIRGNDDLSHTYALFGCKYLPR